MTPRLLLEPEAEREMAEAAAWYDAQAPGLGGEFLRNVRATLAVIERQPALFPVVHHVIRRATLRRFPYAVYYVIEPAPAAVIGCLHMRQDPKRWQVRR